MGYAVQTACTGLVCLACLRQQCPDLLILDFDLTWGGGDGVLARLREDPTLLAPPVILTTHDPNYRPVSWPVIQCFRKPLRLQDLHHAIRSELVLSPGPT
jgi:CheY-like chemotaxis protein